MQFAAVVLAAGESSRMGDVKALLPLGGRSALERVVSAFRAARVDEIVVVTGYHAEPLRPELDRLDVRVAHNPHPERGMFSSVQTGATAVTSPVDAFFVLPVDYSLVRPAVLVALAQSFAECVTDVVHPCCAGLRGHPPLLSTRLRAPLIASSPDSTLRHLLDSHAPQSLDVEVDDLTILMDMDKAEDLQRMRRLAGYLDIPGVADAPARGHVLSEADATAEAPVLTEADALHILSLLQTPRRVVAHCRAVARVGEALATALQPHLPSLDVDLVRSGCLLHDMVRVHGARRHARMGERILSNLGMSRLAAVVGAHMVLPLDPASSPAVSEEEIVYLADKMVVEDRVAGLAEREAQALAKHADDADAPEWIARRMHAARGIAAKIETIMDRTLEAIVPLPPRRVYLVRHAEPVMPDGPRRFLGQTDPPLSAHGIEQAQEVARDLAGIRLTAVYSSDLQRSRHTATILARGRGLAVQEKRWLREIDAGLWEMLTFEQAEELYPKEHAAREADFAGSPFPGGESLRDVEDRVVPGFLDLLEDADGDILIVGHRALNVVLLSHLLSRPLDTAFGIKQDYCAVSVIETGLRADGRRWFTVRLDEERPAG